MGRLTNRCSAPNRWLIGLFAVCFLIDVQAGVQIDSKAGIQAKYEDRPLRLAVAANFSKPAKQLAQRFEQQANHRLIISTASSGALYAQITRGAPFDIFLSADRSRPEQLEKDGLIVIGSRTTYAIGRLALWTAYTLPSKIDTANYTNADTKSGSLNIEQYLAQSLIQSKRIAIANPNTAPYGLVAKQVLQSTGFWNRETPQKVVGSNVLQAFQYRQTGNTDAALVAFHLVKDEQNRIKIPNEFHSRLEQQLVILKSSSQQSVAQAFVEFILQPETQRWLASLGYDPVTN